MSYISLLGRARSTILSSAVLICVFATACGSESGSDDAGTGGTGGTPGPMGCLIQNFPGQPDILVGVLEDRSVVSFPEFEQPTAPPGSTIRFSVYVDSETRLVRATLMDAWRLREPAQGMSDTFSENTGEGDEVIEFAIPIQTTGRYYADLELCGSSCDELRVVYTLNRANAGPESDAINDPYERIVYVDGVEVSSSFTCDNPNSIAIQN